MLVKQGVVQALGLGGLICASACLAQVKDLPDPSPEIRRQDLRLQQLRRELEFQPVVRLGETTEVKAARLVEEMPCRDIAVVAFDGPADLEPELQRSLGGEKSDDSPIGRCLGVQGIAILMDRARNALIAKGYVTSRVEAPPQDLTTGHLRLEVVFGRIAAIDRVSESGRVLNLRPLVPSEVLNLRDIEQSLENLRRNPSVQAEFELRPAVATDATDIVLKVQQGRPLRLNTSLDDSGSSVTGKLIAQGTVSWDSPLGLSDLVYFSASQDAGQRQSGPRGNDSQTLHYSVPWGYWTGGFTATHSHNRQTVVGAFQSYLYSGQTQSSELQLARVVHRDASSKTSIQLKGFDRSSNNFIDDTEVQVQRRRTAGWELSLQHSHDLGPAAGDLQLSFKRGTGAFGALRAPEEAFGEGTSRMQVGTAAINLQWPANWGARLTVTHNLRVQLNRTPLVPQDRLCLGGRSSVRGFDGQQVLCGDRGYVSRNEVIWPFYEAWSTYAGLDFGRVGGRSAAAFPDSFVAGGVLGLRGQPVAFQEGRLNLEVFAGRPFTKPAFLKTASTSMGFSAGLNF